MVSNRQNAKDSFREAREMALDRLLLRPDRITEGPRAGEWPCIKRVVYALGKAAHHFSLIDWLGSQDMTPKIYWRDRDGQFEMAGLGAAVSVHSSIAPEYGQLIEAMKLFLNPDEPKLRFWGGFSFDSERSKGTDTAWRKFGCYNFVIPRFELHRTADSLELAVNINYEEDKDYLADIAEELRELTFPAYGIYNLLPEVTGRRDVPSKRGWTKNINTALKAFKTTELEKVVLARRATFKFEQPPSPAAMMNKLSESADDCFCFLFQPTEDAAFVCVTPERLYHREGRTIRTEAIAGTRARGEDDASDLALGNELLKSGKDIAEHDYVVKSLRDSLNQLCLSSGEKAGRDLLKLANVQHLITRFEGELKPDIGDGDILSELHPTPAVGGHPGALAMGLIEELEPFERGWYAAPVGWIGDEAAEFAVGIRSGLLHRNQLHLFSGAGIVSDSQADQEWDEIERKISNFLSVIDQS
jgi:menaquinone-specific isochorismate synthase